MTEPSYYAGNGLSPLQAFNNGLISEEEYLGFLKGNIIKYVVRAGHKEDPVLDIDKAIDYCHHLKRYYLEETRNRTPNEDLRDIILRENDDNIQKKETWNHIP
jgi:hypothetical protein